MKLAGSIYNWFFNTVRVYSLLALYGLTILPFVKDTLFDEKTHEWVGVFGLIVLMLELPAVYYKLIFIRARDEQVRLNLISQQKEDRIVNPPLLLLFALFMHTASRLLVFMAVLSSFGFNYWGKTSDLSAIFLLMVFFAFEMLAFIFIYIKTRIFIEPGIDTISITEDEADQKRFNMKFLKFINQFNTIKREKWADIIILCFSVVAYVPLWNIINDSGIPVVHEMKLNGYSIPGSLFALSVFISLLSILCLIPLRVTFWIEESMYAKRNQIKPRLGLQFILFAIVTLSPILKEWYHLFISDEITFWETLPEWIRLSLPPLSYLLLILGIELTTKKEVQMNSNYL